MTASPLVVEIKGHSLDDGPGIRSVVFLKGCPLHCSWCHNPEAARAQPELSFDAALCVRSLDCVASCVPEALDPGRAGAAFVDHERCTRCFDCVPRCPSGALSIVGRAMTPAEITDAIARYQPFFANSGGGATLSGGEPLLFMPFAGELLRRLRERGIHTLVETCGLWSLERYLELVEPHVDQLYFDLKLADPAAHALHCGVSNAPILENFRAVCQRARDGGPPVLARVPLVPGLTDTQDNLHAIAELLRRCGAPRVELMPYNPTYESKAQKIGAKARLASSRFMAPAEIERCRAVFVGIEVVG